MHFLGIKPSHSDLLQVQVPGSDALDQGAFPSLVPYRQFLGLEMPAQRFSIGRWVGTGFLIVGLAVLAWLTSQLAATRIYQVDECQNIYMSRVLASGETGHFFTNGSFYILGPLSWIVGRATQSAQVFSNARLLFLGVFWFTLALMAAIASGRGPSRLTLLSLFVASTLAPLWDYGFEIRHDNLVLTGVLLTWWMVRVRPMGVIWYVLAGSLSMVLLFVAVKSLAYVVPLSLAILTFPPPAFRVKRWRLFLGWGVGALLSIFSIRLLYGRSGAWDIYLSVFNHVTRSP